MEYSERPVWRTRAWAVALSLIALVALVLAVFGYDGVPAVWAAVTGAACVVIAILVFTLVRVRCQRREYEEQLTAWATERAAQEERLRIARELHDLASHGLGLITVRAAAATRAQGETRAAERDEALNDIAQISRGATAELRRMLGVLRSSDGQSAPAPLRPAESFDDLPEILEPARRAGLVIGADLECDIMQLGQVSSVVQLTICAIVREGLANAARHAGQTEVDIGLSRVHGAVVVTIQDRGPAPGWDATAGAGQGLRGLRERVSALGGTLDAGPDGAGGYVLRAELPEARA